LLCVRFLEQDVIPRQQTNQPEYLRLSSERKRIDKLRDWFASFDVPVVLYRPFHADFSITCMLYYGKIEFLKRRREPWSQNFDSSIPRRSSFAIRLTVCIIQADVVPDLL
jgi:hypothetical protein